MAYLLFALSSASIFAQENAPLSQQFEQIDAEQREIVSLLLEEGEKMKQTQAAKQQKLQRLEVAARQAKEEQRRQEEAAATLRRQKQKQELEQLRAEQKKLRQQRKAEVQKAKERRITAHIDLSQQKMRVYKGDSLLHTWRVSTAKKGYVTPVGNYHPQYVERMHYSKRYHNSPMPYSIFFKGNFAIHGTNSIRRLGKRASHGCVRLHPKHAKKLYALVRKYGKNNTFIKITY